MSPLSSQQLADAGSAILSKLESYFPCFQAGLTLESCGHFV